MTEVQVRIGNSLLKSLVQMKEKKGDLSMEDVGTIFEQMARHMEEGQSTADQFIRREVEKLASYVQKALEEISSMNPETENGEQLTSAGKELSAVVKATEKAANEIMDAADEIQNHLGKITSHDAHVAQISSATTRIYDACNFQDITGQRVNKVINVLVYLDERIKNLMTMFDNPNGIRLTSAQARNDTRADANLMNGPALDDEAPTQEEIDRLLANLR